MSAVRYGSGLLKYLPVYTKACAWKKNGFFRVYDCASVWGCIQQAITDQGFSIRPG